MDITVETIVRATMEQVWVAWNDPRAIEQWNAASPDWLTPRASVDLCEGGCFRSRMEAKDGSVGFDFAGTYTEVIPNERISYSFGDRRGVVEFIPAGNSVIVRVTFDAEAHYLLEQQRQGWQTILNNFANYVQTRA